MRPQKLIRGIQYLKTDVLVVGSGAAGLAAAIAARKGGAQVFLLSKAKTGAKTTTALSDASLTVESSGFSREDHFCKTMRTGHWLNDPDLVETLVEDGPGIVKWLQEEIGVEFEPLIDQGVKPRGGGRELVTKLRQAAEALGIKRLEDVTLHELWIQDGRCRGAFGITRSGEGVALTAGSVILATGGFSGIFLRHDNPKGQMGDGLALAVKAGAQIRDMEFVQFLMGIAEEGLPHFLIFRPFPPEVKLINEAGEDLLAKHLKGTPLNEAIWSMRDELARALALENERSATYLDLTAADWGQAHRWFGLQYLKRFSFPFQEKPLRVSPIAHYTMGGVVIDRDGRTSIPQLYAAGEVASGVHGANRHGGNSLMDCLVFGHRAGRHAALHSKSSTSNPKRSRPRSDVQDRYFSQFVHQRGGMPLPKVQEALHQLADTYLGPLRDAKGLRRAKKELQELQSMMDRVQVTTPSDVQKRIEVEGGILSAVLVADFALAREESRGSHYRRDFPNRAAHWQCSQFGWCADGTLNRLGRHSRRGINLF